MLRLQWYLEGKDIKFKFMTWQNIFNKYRCKIPKGYPLGGQELIGHDIWCMGWFDNEPWSPNRIWPIEHTDQISKDSLLLKFQGKDFAILEDPETFEYNLDKLISLFYGTDNPDHPGVQITKKSPHVFITGKLLGINKLHKILNVNYLEPNDVKKIIKKT